MPNARTANKVSETEIGHAASSQAGFSSIVDLEELVPELAWPQSIAVYDKMRRNAQVAAILLSIELPIRQMRWAIDPNGARDEVVAHVADDLGLPVKGQAPGPRKRRRNRFSWDRHLHHVLLKNAYGHMYFEQVYRIGDDGLAHIRKLAPRMPATISEIKVARDGGLESIKQSSTGAAVNGRLLGLDSPTIPVDRLVAYINEQEGGNWIGHALLRAMYPHWFIKDRLMRVDAIKHERTGAGTPVIEAPPGANAATTAKLDEFARRFRAGEVAGGSLPAGAKLRLVGVEGSLPDTVGSMRYHDEQMARRAMQMFSQLGSTQTGSRALGETFMDFFSLALQAAAREIADVTNDHIIEDLVDVNWGEDEPAPLIVADETEEEVGIDVLTGLIESGLLVVDDEIADWVRSRYNMPARTPDTPATPTPLKTAARKAVKAGSIKLPARALRRDPFDHEVAAATDFAAMEARHVDQLDELLDSYKQVRIEQLDELQAQIEGLADGEGALDGLDQISVTPKGHELLTDAMIAVLVAAFAAVRAELKSQGIEIDDVVLDDAKDAAAARATATMQVLAAAMSQAAIQQIVLRAGGSMSASDIASEVRAYIEGLSDQFIRDQLSGALQAAENAARVTAFEQTGENIVIYASELLDSSTCEPCLDVDGTQYASLEEATAAYPTGGFADCLGGPRCRGTLVLVSADEAPATT